MRLFGAGKSCPACNAVMDVEVITHRAIGTDQRPILYHGVRRYTCPDGCRTALVDFRKATVDKEGLGARGWHPTSEIAAAAVPLGWLRFLERLDVAYIVSVLGLIVSYLIFLWAIVVTEGDLILRGVFAALLTAGLIAMMMMLAPPRRQAAVEVEYELPEEPEEEAKAN